MTVEPTGAIRVARHTTEMDAADPVLLDLLDIWEEKRRGRRMPSRNDLSPPQLQRHLGWIHLFDVIDEPLDFRFRLYGSSVAQMLGHDATGKLLSEAFPRPFLNSVFPAFEALIEDKRPRLLASTGAGANKEFMSIQSLMLPLSDDDDRVNVVLVRHLFTNV